MDLEAVQLMTHTEEGASALIWSIAIYLYYISYILECENIKAKVESKVVMTTGLLAAEIEWINKKLYTRNNHTWQNQLGSMHHFLYIVFTSLQLY